MHADLIVLDENKDSVSAFVSPEFETDVVYLNLITTAYSAVIAVRV